MPVVVLYGEESFLLEQAAVRLRQDTVDPAMASLCHRVYTAPSLATVLEAVGGVSLALGGQTLVEIRDFPFLTQSAKDNGTEAQLEELRGLLEGVEPNKTVLFLSSKIDGKIKFSKWLVKNTAFHVQKFESLKFWETDKARDFLMAMARERGTALQEEAADMLVSAMGTDLRALANELNKLELYAHQRAITRDDIQRMGSHSDNLFQLVNRWILRESPEANFGDLTELLTKRNPVEIMVTIQSYYNNLFRLVWLNAQGCTLDTIAQRTGQKPFKIKKDLALFRSVPLERWIQLKHWLVDREWRAKTGQLEPTLALETLLGR